MPFAHLKQVSQPLLPLNVPLIWILYTLRAFSNKASPVTLTPPEHWDFFVLLNQTYIPLFKCWFHNRFPLDNTTRCTRQYCIVSQNLSLVLVNVWQFGCHAVHQGELQGTETTLHPLCISSFPPTTSTSLFLSSSFCPYCQQNSV